MTSSNCKIVAILLACLDAVAKRVYCIVCGMRIASSCDWFIMSLEVGEGTKEQRNPDFIFFSVDDCADDAG